MTNAQTAAINLLLEDLHTIHPEIRTEAKEQNCERELEEYKREILLYLIAKLQKKGD